MSIEFTGPQGYEYQYIATVYIGLNELVMKRGTMPSLWVEKVGSEDAELNLVIDGKDIPVEIQVKNAAGDVTLGNLSEWLCHFESDSSVNCTVSRLRANPSKRFLLISSARCTDETKSFLSSPNGLLSYNPVPSLALQRKMLSFISEYEKKAATALKKARRQQIAADFKQDKVGLKHVLERVSVWESALKDNLLQEIQHVLNKGFKIPQSQTSAALLKLLEAVKEEGRDRRKDIIPFFNKIIENFKGDKPVLSTHYIIRQDESGLVDMVRENGGVLLTGLSFCGKSDTAKSIAQVFYEEGYAFRHTTDADEAARFLKDTVLEDRVCLLEDPMGHQYDSVDSAVAWRKTQELFKNLPPGRKLIVTSNLEVVKNLSASPFSTSWQDLTATDRDFLKAIWLDVGEQLQLPNQLSIKVLFMFANDDREELLQPGQLHHLASNREELIDLSRESIRHLARVDAALIGAQVSRQGNTCERVFRVLACLSDAVTGVQVDEIAYVLASPDELASIAVQDETGLQSFGFSDFNFDTPPLVLFPEYGEVRALEQADQDALDFLEEKRYVAYMADKVYRFTHPIYVEAARMMMKNLPRGKSGSLRKDVRVALSTLSVPNALVASRHLKFLFHVYKDTELKDAFIEMGFEGLHSIFPAVQDRCLTFLIQVFGELSGPKIAFLQNKLANPTQFELGVSWSGGIPFIPRDDKTRRYLLYQENSISDKEYQDLTGLLIAKDQKALPETAFKVAKHIKEISKQAPVQLQTEVLEALLDYEESFIREMAAFQVFWLFENPPRHLVDKALSDEHPSVVFRAVMGAIRGWNYYDKGRQAHLLLQLKKSFDREDVILRSLHFMTQFAIDYSGKSFDWKGVEAGALPGMWQVWAELMPLFFDELPHNVHFHKARFWVTMSESVSYLDLSQKQAITLSWLDWFNRFLGAGGWFESFLSVTDYFFLFATELAVPDRQEISLKLIQHADHRFSTYNVRYFIERWAILTQEEREAIKERILAEEADMLRAVALTTEKVPLDVVESVTGHPDALRYEAKVLVGFLPGQLLRDCMAILFLDPGYEFILPSSGTHPWYSLLNYYISQPHHPMCAVAVKVLLDDFFYKDDVAVSVHWGDAEGQFRKLVKTGESTILEWIGQLLLEHTASFSSSGASALWMILLEGTDAQFHTALKSEILSNIEAIEKSDNFKLVARLPWVLQVEDLPGDMFVIEKGQKPFSLPESEGLCKTVFTSCLDNQTLRLVRSHVVLRRWWESNCALDAAFGQKIETSRLACLERAGLQQEHLSAHIYNRLSFIIEAGTHDENH